MAGGRAFAQHLGVVDFPNFHMLTAGGRPEPCNSAFDQQLLGRTAQQQEERAPGGRIGTVQDAQFAD